MMISPLLLLALALAGGPVAAAAPICSYGSYSQPCRPTLAPCGRAGQSWRLHTNSSRLSSGGGLVDLVAAASGMCLNVYGCSTTGPPVKPLWMWPCVLSRTGGCENTQANQVGGRSFL